MPDRTLLGFDYGRQRIGVAVGQEITRTAQPLVTLNRIQNKPDWSGIDALVEQWRPDILIVGLPAHMDEHPSEKPHPLHDEIKAFGNQLAERYNLPVDWIDERLSSLEAQAALATSKKKKSQRRDKAQIDQLAARFILETYLNSI